jgi:anti-sigma-K factor RskA
MPCTGLPADVYDRYVLGLLDEPERSQLETEIQDQCPSCLRGVQRSMNLWLVFASTLQNEEPSADFRARLIHIAELSRKILTFPKGSKLQGRITVLSSTLIIMAAMLSVLLLATWYAGRQSIRLDTQPLSTDLDRLAQQVANDRIRLQEEIQKRIEAERQLGSSGRSAIGQASQLKQSLNQSQAEAQEYKTVIARDSQLTSENVRLIGMLNSAGAKLLPMRGGEGTSGAVAYILMIDKSKLVFVGSNLPKPEADHQFQIWLHRKEEPKVVSAGVFAPDDKNHAVVEYTERSLLSEVSFVAITQEPIGGSSAPTSPRLFETSAGATASSEED